MFRKAFDNLDTLLSWLNSNSKFFMFRKAFDNLEPYQPPSRKSSRNRECSRKSLENQAEIENVLEIPRKWLTLAHFKRSHRTAGRVSKTFQDENLKNIHCKSILCDILKTSNKMKLKRSVTWDKMAQIWCVPRGWRAQNHANKFLNRAKVEI
jgi:hypothetical protein